MKNVLLLLLAIFVFSLPGCKKPVDKADEPVEEVEIEGVPPL